MRPRRNEQRMLKNEVKWTKRYSCRTRWIRRKNVCVGLKTIMRRKSGKRQASPFVGHVLPFMSGVWPWNGLLAEGLMTRGKGSLGPFQPVPCTQASLFVAFSEKLPDKPRLVTVSAPDLRLHVTFFFGFRFISRLYWLIPNPSNKPGIYEKVQIKLMPYPTSPSKWLP